MGDRGLPAGEDQCSGGPGASGALERAPCGYGAFGQCCCTCRLQLVVKPRCFHIGGRGNCGETKPQIELDGAALEIAKIAQEAEYPPGVEYACLAFARDGIVMTNWTLHGCCEAYMPRVKADGSKVPLL